MNLPEWAEAPGDGWEAKSFSDTDVVWHNAETDEHAYQFRAFQVPDTVASYVAAAKKPRRRIHPFIVGMAGGAAVPAVIAAVAHFVRF